MSANTPFPGFANPTENYYRLPNTWVDHLAELRIATGSRIIASLKLLEYVLKHTWGYQRFEGQVRLTAREIRTGRGHRGRQIDTGTGLSANSVRKAAQKLTQHGFLELLTDDR
ncbi:MAG: hypothetical protein GY792_30270, partial [Gammaproteobacteria bacterium]|nr:hypothetical protein [Gammaproteobacteria bacterium]